MSHSHSPDENQASVESPSRAQRALQRQSWPGRTGNLATMSDAPEGTCENVFEEVFALSNRAWAMTGQPLPSYLRRDIPGQLRKLGAEPK